MYVATHQSCDFNGLILWLYDKKAPLVCDILILSV